jgi:hypothetical protein
MKVRLRRDTKGFWCLILNTLVLTETVAIKFTTGSGDEAEIIGYGGAVILWSNYLKPTSIKYLNLGAILILDLLFH